MEEYEYMLMPLHLFPQNTIDQYKLQENAQNGQVYLEVRRDIYGLSQAGALANKQLKNFLAPSALLVRSEERRVAYILPPQC